MMVGNDVDKLKKGKKQTTVFLFPFSLFNSRYLNHSILPILHFIGGLLKSLATEFVEALFIPEHNGNRNAGEIEILAEFIFQVSFIRVFDVLRKVGEKSKRGRWCR
jgi:hypothetical protein